MVIEGTGKPETEEVVEVKETQTETATEPQTQDGQAEDQTKKTVVPQEEVQKRINKLYARIKTEEEAKLKAKSELKKVTAERDQLALIGEEDEEESAQPKSKGLTEDDVRRLLQEKEIRYKQEEIEKNVYSRHPEMINEDGTFNLNDPFVQKIKEIGKRYPYLSGQIDGLEVAEKLAVIELNLPYEQGRKDERTRKMAEDNAYTATSTTASPKPSSVKLTDKQKEAARKAGMSEEDWVKYSDQTMRIG